MKTKKASLIEKVEISDRETAEKIVKGAERKVARIKIGLIIAAVSTFMSILGLILSSNVSVMGFLLFFALISSIASYAVGGGITIALRAAGKLAKFGWFILPFPYDIFTGIFLFFVAVYAFFFIPVVFVFINYSQHKDDLTCAEEYLAACAE